VELALQRPDVAPMFREFLRGLRLDAASATRQPARSERPASKRGGH